MSVTPVYSTFLIFCLFYKVNIDNMAADYGIFKGL